MLNVENISKNVEMLKNVGTKINFSTQIILFFDEFKKFIINPYFYQHLFSSLFISIVTVLGFLPIVAKCKI